MAAATWFLALARRLVGCLLLHLDFGQFLRGGVDLSRRLLLVLLCPGQGGLGRVRRSALGGRLGRGHLGFVIELVGRVGGDLRRGFRLLRRLLSRIVSLLQWERGGLGVVQRFVQGGLGVGHVGQGLYGSGHVGLGLLQLFDARLARQILRISSLLSLCLGHFARVGVCRVGLLHRGL